MAGVIKDLHFWSRELGRICGFADAKHDAAVPGRGDPPLDEQLEVDELVDRDQVAAASGPRQRAVDRLPSAWHRRLLESPPAGGACAIEEQAPSSRALGICQRVGITRLVDSRRLRGARAGRGQERQREGEGFQALHGASVTSILRSGEFNVSVGS